MGVDSTKNESCHGTNSFGTGGRYSGTGGCKLILHANILHDAKNSVNSKLLFIEQGSPMGCGGTKQEKAALYIPSKLVNSGDVKDWS